MSVKNKEREREKELMCFIFKYFVKKKDDFISANIYSYCISIIFAFFL